MITLRLFHQSDPFHQIEERQLETGELVIGRGEAADWSLTDPARLLSRRHCSIRMAGQSPTLQDLSANGVFIGPTRARAASNEAVNLQAGETLRLGDYMIVVDRLDGPLQPAAAKDALADIAVLRPVEIAAPGDPATSDERPAKTNGDVTTTSAKPPGDDEALLEAFCAGAHIDASAFADEDPAAVMRRLGAIYQQMIAGLTGLMDERTTVKCEYRMDRTAIRPAGNNPFRWASAQRVAVDLLRERSDGFLFGPVAVKATFGDVKKHLLCVFAGSQAAVDATLQALSPKAIEARIPARAALLKSRAAAAWREYLAAHDECSRETAEDAESLLNREFRVAYGRRLAELDAADEATSDPV